MRGRAADSPPAVEVPSAPAAPKVTPELADTRGPVRHVTVAGATAFGAQRLRAAVRADPQPARPLRRGGGRAQPHRRALREGRLRLLQRGPAAAGSRRPELKVVVLEGSVVRRRGRRRHRLARRCASASSTCWARCAASGRCQAPRARAPAPAGGRHAGRRSCTPAPGPTVGRARQGRCWWSAARSSASSRSRSSTASRPCPTPSVNFRAGRHRPLAAASAATSSRLRYLFALAVGPPAAVRRALRLADRPRRRAAQLAGPGGVAAAARDLQRPVHRLSRRARCSAACSTPIRSCAVSTGR